MTWNAAVTGSYKQACIVIPENRAAWAKRAAQLI